MVTLVEAPRGLDMPVSSVALVDADDVRLGLAVGPGSADVFFLLGVSDVDARRLARTAVAGATRGDLRQGTHRAGGGPGGRRWAPRSSPSNRGPAGSACTAWSTTPSSTTATAATRCTTPAPTCSGWRSRSPTAPAAWSASRTTTVHVLAYSASSDEADELRRLSILGRAGPPEHLEWIGQWGIFDALRAGARRGPGRRTPRAGAAAAPGGRHPPARRGPAPRPGFAGTIWLQQGSAPLADDAEEVLRGGAVLAARIMARLAATPSHARRPGAATARPGATPRPTTSAALARELGIPRRRPRRGGRLPRRRRRPLPADVIALSASAFRADAQVVSGRRPGVYVLLPKIAAAAVGDVVGRAARSAALRRELGLEVRAVIAAPAGRAGRRGAGARRGGPGVRQRRAPSRRDRSGHVAGRGAHHGAARRDRLAGRRPNRGSSTRGCASCASRTRCWPTTLRAYLDGFGDVAAIAAAAARAPEHRALPHPADREAAGDLVGRRPTTALRARARRCAPPTR